MSPRVQRACIWSIVPFVAIYSFAFVGLAGFVPPISPAASSEEVAAFYEANRFGIRAGQLIMFVSSGFMFIWPAAISAQMAQIEGPRFPMLAIVQYVTAAVLGILFMICSLLWTCAAFRPEMAPDSIRMFNDSGWLLFVMGYPEYIVQLGCVAIIGLSDMRAQPWLPRWACYMTLWVVFAGLGGSFATFFKTGPFAFNGLIGFWLPIIFFLAWVICIILPFTLRAIARDLAEDAN